MKHVILLALALAGCGRNDSGPAAAAAPKTVSVTVTWTANGNDSYYVYYRPAGSLLSSKVNAGKAALATISGFKRNTDYYFAMTAYNSGGESKKTAEQKYHTGLRAAQSLTMP